MKERRDIERNNDFKKAEAIEVAKKLIEHAQETARQMILNSNLDVSKLPLICFKIIEIQKNVSIIQDNIMWGVRIIVGAVLLAGLALIFK